MRIDIMKTYKMLNITYVSLLMSIMFLGCTDDFEEINTDPLVLTELDASLIGNIYARAQYRGFDINYHQVSQNVFADHYCQYYANTQNAFPSDRYVLVGGWLNFAWRAFYENIAGNLSIVLEATDPVENPGFETLHALAQIWRVIVYERTTNKWGPIPYFSVNNAEASVPYDSERDIYMSFFETLDGALAILNQNQGGNAFGGHDQIYGGDIDQWIRFANTLRLRIAMRISAVEPAIAQDEAEKAVLAGVMTDNSHDANFQTTPNSTHGMNRYTPWNEFRMSATMESVLNGYDDPRKVHFFTPSVTDGAFRGLRNGYEIVDLQGLPELDVNNLSAIGPRWQDVAAKDFNPYEIMQSAEAYFLRAEGALNGWDMGGTAEEFYNMGIEKSLIHWGISDAGVIAAYQQSSKVPVATHDAPAPVSTVPVKYDAATALEQIHTQKWLGLFPDGWEAWAEQRRTKDMT